MKMRQRIQKADAAEVTVTDDSSATATHRLTGISVKEVSIVDRAANKRKYLLVKEEEQKKDAPAAKSGDEATKAVPGSPAQPPAAPTPPASPTTPQPPTLRISPELKAKVAGVLKTVQERVGVISKVLEGSSETPGAAAPQELMTALNELASMITTAVAPAAPAPGATPPAAPPPAAAKTEEATAETEKAGRKISAGRLQQLTAIQTSLASLIADVSANEVNTTGEGGEAASAATTEPASTSAEKSVASTEFTELKTAVASMAESMASMMKVFEQQNTRIAELTKSRGESRQADLDERSSGSKTTEEKVVWDMDMARTKRNIE